MTIHLHIEQLVLDGLQVDNRRALQSAIQNELTRRITEGGLSSELRSNAAVPSLNGGVINFGHDRRPATLGHQIANAVYRGIGAKK